MTDELDRVRMNEALALARRGWGQTRPNPMVGAVIYRGEEKVSEGYHSRFGESHAEAMAIESAGGRANGATLYVTLEPCTHRGKTPPCADAITAAGLTRVVIAMPDPNPVASGGANRLRATGVTVEMGVGEAEAAELNADFINSHKSARPWVTLKLAVSLDGAISGANRQGGWLSGTESRDEVQRMRANVDAIAVGVKTAIADNPRLTARSDPPPRVNPIRIVFDRSARLPASSDMAQTAREIPTILVTAGTTQLPDELARLGVEALPASDVGNALGKLRARGVLSLMVEGGAGLAASFLAGGHVDRLVIFRTPIILGDGALGAFAGVASQEIEHAPRFRLRETRALGDDVLSVYSMDSH